MVYLRKPTESDVHEVMAAYECSQSIHHPWVFAPTDFDAYLKQEGRYFLCKQPTGEILGTFNISGIIRGNFHSAYLGYEVFHPHNGKGYMSRGLELLLKEAFEVLNLHRLEANVQPENFASIHLVAKSGFVKEGFSRNYLRIGGVEWKDHERWAIVNECWQ
jgi:ribosomal-protein-alanine N-acetyltransferase